MNIPFNIKFVLFDESKEVSQNEKEIRKNLIYNNFRYIIKEVFDNDANYKWLDRTEASVSSIDENKQLRLRFDTLHNENKKYQYSLHFHQIHTGSKEYFTIEELKYISDKIKIGLETFLHYEIDFPTIYIETNNYILEQYLGI
jgi:hypothetical protein